MKNVLEYLERSARCHPERTAFADVRQEMTFAQLQRRAMEIGTCLIRQIDPCTPVALYLEKGTDAIAAMLGIVYAGGYYVTLDQRHPRARIMQILDTLQPALILSDERSRNQVEAMETGIPCVEIKDLKGPADLDALMKVRQEQLDIDPLYAIFTSGSTGAPKGVVVAHRSVIDFIDVFTSTFDITADDVIGNQAPWDFDVSVKDIYSGLCAGACVQIIPKAYFSMPMRLLDFLCERQVTTLIWAVSALCIISSLDGLAYRVPKTLNKIMFSGEVMPVRQLNIWRSHLPDALYVNLYGPTEITCNCTYHIIDREYEETESIPIGKAFDNERVFLLDEQGNEVRTPEEVGEICVSGTAVSLGYFRNPQQSGERFVSNPLRPYWNEIMYRTGDLGRYDENGLLHFLSRKDFQIKHMGHRIELGEIEAVMQRMPGVERACCLYEDHHIVAFYCGTVSEKELRRALRQELPAYMIPDHLYVLTQMPLNNNGKIDRKALQERRDGTDVQS